MRLPITKTLKVYPNPWGVSPAAVTDKAMAARKALKLNAADHSTMDHVGRPNGAFMADSIADGGEPGRRVGAVVCERHTTTRSHGRVFLRTSFDTVPQRTVYAFNGVTAHETEPYELAGKLAKTEPITLPLSEYYKDALRTGELLAADAETAKEAEVGFDFEAPETLFPKLAKAAAEAFDAHYSGAKAYEHFVGERKKAHDAAKADAAAAAAASAPAANVDATSAPDKKPKPGDTPKS
jgi:hypothetical protein